ncbi:MAG TPA: family 20 glycosylhydrolase [Chitinophagales bacterium]|nr:family 20 glycosylhydrolase [Chitinophagales bacterium]
MKKNLTCTLHFPALTFCALFISIFFSPKLTAQSSSGIIPAPVSLQAHSGNFSLRKETIITWDNDEDSSSARLFNDYVMSYYHFGIIRTAFSDHSTNVIRLLRATDHELPKEGYELTVSENQISIRGDGAGIFYGLQTLKQLLPATPATQIKINACSVIDYPRYAWRGMMLDVSRHFFPKEEVKQFIDLLAAYKMNTFHWHLTDDQGWRIEIKKYPKLTAVGAWRSGTLIGHHSNNPQFDTIRYGGFYTQDDVKEVVAYAQKRKITVMPEIEMPGHTSAVLAAYPELACSGGPFEVEKNWGIFKDVMCPTELSIHFMEDVLEEVIPLFPSKYIHIGGDECPKDRWKTSDYCHQVMKQFYLKDENALQSYFTQRIEQFANAKGKSIIGWDEILEGGLARNAAIMSWRGTEGGIAAASQNHYVVMSPTSNCYFDYYQSKNPNDPLAIGGFLPVEKVYSYEPTPSELSSDQQKFILGAQANLWTEYIPTFKQVEFMILPRLCAMAEVDWTQKDKRNFDDFAQRLIQYHFPLFDLWNVNYSKAITDVNMNITGAKDADGLTVQLYSFDKNSKIHYALGDSSSHPSNTQWQNYSKNISISHSATLLATAVSGKDDQAGNDPSRFVLNQNFEINKATGKEITLEKQPSIKYNTGGAFALVNGIWGRLPWNGSEWLGFEGGDLVATIDLGMKENFSTVTLGVLNENGSWIYLPKKVEVFISDDGTNFTSAGAATFDAIKNSGGRKAIMSIGNVSARYVKVVAINYGLIPDGNAGAGHPAWLLVDEISIE